MILRTRRGTVVVACEILTVHILSEEKKKAAAEGQEGSYSTQGSTEEIHRVITKIVVGTVLVLIVCFTETITQRVTKGDGEERVVIIDFFYFRNRRR